MSDRSQVTNTNPADSEARPVPPAVDVFEDADGITLLADMPGVTKDSLDIRLDGDRLTVEGRVQLGLPADLRAIWAEVQVPRFSRAFTLSRELDASRIQANLKDGVLNLRVPKLAMAQPRRIEVQSG